MGFISDQSWPRAGVFFLSIQVLAEPALDLCSCWRQNNHGVHSGAEVVETVTSEARCTLGCSTGLIHPLSCYKRAVGVFKAHTKALKGTLLAAAFSTWGDCLNVHSCYLLKHSFLGASVSRWNTTVLLIQTDQMQLDSTPETAHHTPRPSRHNPSKKFLAAEISWGNAEPIVQSYGLPGNVCVVAAVLKTLSAPPSVSLNTILGGFSLTRYVVLSFETRT